ncbi:hypothetical protein KBC89_03450 [Candidatus Woesebacteria bacterium]|nr:hypothetical protein [Candidatus Woesebacteria bacterium]
MMQKIVEKQQSQELLTPIKSVLIIGTGAIGSMFEAEFSQKNEQLDVAFLSHETIPAEVLANAEVIILTTPNHSVKRMVVELLNKIPDTAELPMLVLIQNGVGVVEQAHLALAESTNPDRRLSIVRASVFTQVTKKGDQLDYNAEKLRVALSPIGCSPEDFRRAGQLFLFANFQTRNYENYQSLEWTKLLFNTLGTTSMITGLPPSITFADKELYQLEMNAFAQRCNILRQCGIPIAQIDWVKTQMLPALEIVRHISFFKPARKALAGLISNQRNDQPSAAWHKVEEGGDLAEAIHYHQALIDLAEQNSMEAPTLDLAIVSLLREQAANKLDLQDLTPEERKQRLIAKTQELKANN